MLDGRSVDKRAPTSFVGSHSADDGISRRAQCQIELYIYMCEQDLQRQRGNGRSVYIATMYTWKFVFCCFSPAGWRAERQRRDEVREPNKSRRFARRTDNYKHNDDDGFDDQEVAIDQRHSGLA